MKFARPALALFALTGALSACGFHKGGLGNSVRDLTETEVSGDVLVRGGSVELYPSAAAARDFRHQTCEAVLLPVAYQVANGSIYSVALRGQWIDISDLPNISHIEGRPWPGTFCTSGRLFVANEVLAMAPVGIVE